MIHAIFIEYFYRVLWDNYIVRI